MVSNVLRTRAWTPFVIVSVQASAFLLSHQSLAGFLQELANRHRQLETIPTL